MPIHDGRNIKIKRKQLNNIRINVEWMIGRNSKLSTQLNYYDINKFSNQYSPRHPVMGMQCQIKIIQVFQNKVLREYPI